MQTEIKTGHEISLLEVFFTFLRIGMFTFGGGLAMLNVIRHELLEKKKWINNEDFLDLIIVSTSIPGLIAVNCAYQLGHKMRGWTGAFFAIIGVIIPSFFIILVIVSQLGARIESPAVQAFLRGSSAAVLAQIAYSSLIFGKDIIFDKYSVLITVFGLVLLLSMHLHPIPVIFICIFARFLLPARVGKLK